ncbi:MAG: glycosyltransferase, partial [Deltaproteobacteria bacterium]
LSGYATAFTTVDRIATLSDHPLFLPRIEVFGEEDLAAFAKRIGLNLNDAGKSRGVNLQVPLVSVVIPAYNAENTIDETLHSVRGQTYAKLEIIVVDDGSTDSTAAHVFRHCTEDPRVRLIQQPNQGLAAARNAGITGASSDYIAPVDADDLWHPTKIERQKEAMMAGDGEVGLVYTWYALIDENSRVISSMPGPINEGNVLQRMCRGNLIGNGSSPLMLRQAVLEAGGYDRTLQDRGAQGCEDWNLYFQLAEKYKFAVVADHLTGYRQLPGSMSSNVPRMMRSYDMVMQSFLKKYPQYADDFRMGKSETLYWYLMQALRGSRWQDALMVARMMMKHDSLFMMVRVCINMPLEHIRRFGISGIGRRLFHLFARPLRPGSPPFFVMEKNNILAPTKEQ